MSRLTEKIDWSISVSETRDEAERRVRALYPGNKLPAWARKQIDEKFG